VQVGVEPGVAQVDLLQLDGEPCLGPPGQKLLGDGRRVVVGDQHGRRDPAASPQGLDQVGLLEQGVAVRGGLVRGAEAEQASVEPLAVLHQ
jgi:hypothetical protein